MRRHKGSLSVLVFLLVGSGVAATAANRGPQVWVARHGNTTSAVDVAHAMTVDSAGNVYVTGVSGKLRIPFDVTRDYVTVKYDRDGNEVWVARHDSGQDDEATALALDPSGNVVVTGTSKVSGRTDYITVKYDTKGQKLWSVRHSNGGGNPMLALDGDGNIYIAAVEGDSPLGNNRIVKYTSSGQELWSVRHDSGGDDEARGLAVDPTGSVYVSGIVRIDCQQGIHKAAQLECETVDYQTVKYDTDGNKIWVARYDSGGVDRVEAVVIGGDGGIYVTGSSGVGGDEAFATVKYDANGNEVWVARHDEPENARAVPTALTTDRSGNVYVTGTAQGDYVTLKYDPDGNEVWTARLGGRWDDRPTGIAVDAAGNVHVTGLVEEDFGTVKYNSEGNELWFKLYKGPWRDRPVGVLVDVDEAGNVQVAGSSGIWVSGLPGNPGTASDFVTVKYDSSGNELWSSRYDRRIKALDTAQGVAVDDAGNVYVTGSSVGFARGISSTYTTMKYDRGGRALWVRDEPGRGKPALALDGAGNVCVAGGFETEYIVLKYDPDGNRLWAVTDDGPDGTFFQPIAIAADDTGNVYVTGPAIPGAAGTSKDFATVKYDASSGNKLWVAIYDSGFDVPRDLVIDSAGNVYVTGSSGVNGSWDYATVKYDVAGNELWVATYDGDAGGYDEAVALVLDDSGNLYVTGSSLGAGTAADYATVKYDPEGRELWVARYDGTASAFDRPKDLAADGAGNVYVTGGSNGRGTGWDYATVKYDPTGNPLWVARYQTTPFGGNEVAEAVALDGEGNVYVTGTSPTSGSDYTTIRYSEDGVELEIARYDSGGEERVSAMTLDTDGNVYVTGVSREDFATVKYKFTTSPELFRRGDSNADGNVDISDPLLNLNFQFVGTFDPPCRDALDFDDSGELDVTDPIANLTHQFLGGPPPAPPGKDACGVDPTADQLTCDNFAACAGGG